MAIKLGGSAATPQSLLLYPLDSDGSDASGTGNDLTLSGANISSVVAKYGGGSLAVGGSLGNWKGTGTMPVLDGDFTCEFWLYLGASSTSDRYIVDRGEGSAFYYDSPGWAIGTGGSTIFLQVKDSYNAEEAGYGASLNISSTTTQSAIVGSWVHVAVVRQGTTYRLYIDGTQEGSGSGSATSFTAAPFAIGAPLVNGSGMANGSYIDDFRLSGSAVYPDGTSFTPPTAAHPTGAGSTGDISALYLGSSAVSSVYLGGSSVWSAGGGGGGNSITPGQLYGWGDNDSGQLGDGSTTDRSYALGAVDSNLWIAAAISLESGGHALAIRDDGTLYAAGSNFFGYFLNSVQYTSSNTWVLADSGSWKSVGAGSSHSLGVKSDGTLVAAGYNTAGQLGSGNNTDNHIVAQIGSDTDWATAYAALNHSYAIKTDGTLWAWGDNTYGQLGDGSTTARNAPVQVGSAAWTKISPNRFHTLGLQTDGSLWAWGTNGNRFGDGGTNNSNTPVQIGSDTWIDIAAGRSHSVGIKSDGTLWGWGYSTTGAHGSGTATLSSPTQIGSASTWAKVAAGNDHSAAIDSSGIRYLFGTASNNRSSGATTPTSAGTDIWSLIVTQGTSSLGIAVAP